MDALDLIQTHCSPPLIAHAEATDPRAPNAYFWPQGDPGRIEDRTPECRAAFVAFFAPGIGPASQDVTSMTFFANAARVAGLLQPDMRDLVESAARRIVPSGSLGGPYFDAAHALQLDLRDKLEGKVVEPASLLPATENSYYFYQIYLARYGDPEAVTWLKDRLAGLTDANDASDFIVTMPDDVPDALRPVLTAYVDDTRGIRSSAGFAVNSVGMVARQKLGGTFRTPNPAPLQPPKR